MYTNSIQLFDALTRRRLTDERRYMINILAARRFYEQYELTTLGHTMGINNPTDYLTKIKQNNIIHELYNRGIMSREAKK